MPCFATPSSSNKVRRGCAVRLFSTPSALSLSFFNLRLARAAVADAGSASGIARFRLSDTRTSSPSSSSSSSSTAGRLGFAAIVAPSIVAPSRCAFFSSFCALICIFSLSSLRFEFFLSWDASAASSALGSLSRGAAAKPKEAANAAKGSCPTANAALSRASATLRTYDLKALSARARISGRCAKSAETCAFVGCFLKCAGLTLSLLMGTLASRSHSTTRASSEGSKTSMASPFLLLRAALPTRCT
mmetsp:Transcript_7179/g.23387  ORF Transcript_7179/g.23387 Transcript_7179/m.23387 type:complete len:246 (-) Transcript_7179:1245-1982(-)